MKRIFVAREEADGKAPTTYASRKTLDLYWQRRMSTDVDHAIRVGHAFLGLRLECAQCHRHPSDIWTQDDLLSFGNFFMRVPHYSAMGGPRARATACDRPVRFRCGQPLGGRREFAWKGGRSGHR